MSKARFAILGPLAVTYDGKPVKMETRGLRRRLLAALLVGSPYPVSEDKLAAILWGGEPEGFRGQRLQPVVSRLRATLKAPGDQRIVHQGSAYVIELERDELDAFVFDDLRKRAVEALRKSDPATAVDLSDRALALWRGAALTDFADEPFAVERARQLDGFRLEARQVRIEALLASGGRDAEVVPEAEALRDADPDNDAVWGSLMLALHRCGRPGKAEATYRDYLEHVGTGDREPAAVIVALHGKITTNDLDLAWRAPDAQVAVPSDTSAAPRTFLFTAVEVHGSRDAKPDAAAREIHDAVLGEVAAAHRGRPFGDDGHGACVVFERPGDAVLAARDLVRDLRAAAEVADCRTLRVRMAVHTGEASPSGASFTGPAITRVGRLRDAGHPGQVVISSVTRELVADELPADVRVMGIGACQFAGSPRPERVFQLVDPDLPSEFPPLRGGRRLLGEMPRYTTGFVGREHEVTEIAGRLAAPGLVTITGSGGIGKTRLAVEVAERLTPSVAEGVCYCDVARLDDEATLVERLAVARGLTVTASPDPRRELVRSFEAVELLLVLDGCERLKDPVRQLVTEIVAAGAEVRVLVTSLGRLEVTVEHVVKLGPLSVQGPTEREPEAAPAVLLLRNRAAQAGVPLAPTDPRLAELAGRLDGLPLAIELVAPLLGQFSPATVIDRLDRVLAAASGAPDAPDRHRTLRATFDWSFDLVSSEARRLFGALSMFRDPWSLETAEAVAPGVEVEPDAVMGLTTELVDQSLVRVEMPPDGAARYTMLDALRRYGHEDLRASGRDDEVADIHARHFLDLAERAVPHRRGPAETAWAGELNAQFADLRVAYRRFVDTGRHAEALRLTVALTHDLLMRERLEIGRWALELADLPALVGHPGRVEALGLAATAAMLEARLDDAVALARAAVEAEQATGAPASWTARNVLAMMTAVGRIEGRRWTDHLRDMVEIGARAGDPFPEALAHWDRVLVAIWTKDARRGEKPATALVALGNRLDNPSIRSMGLLALGRVAARLGDGQRARDLLQQAWGAAETAHTALVLGQTRRELANLDTRSDDPTAALTTLRALIEDFSDSGNVAEQLQTALTIAEKLADLGALVSAAVALEVMDRTLLGKTLGYDEQRERVNQGLTEAEREEANRTAGGMSQPELVTYLVREVDGLIDAARAGPGESE